jgi:hypothetical protein
MSLSLRATPTGLTIVDQARQRRGWTKTSTARWWQDAHTSRATLRRFWQGDRIQRDIFIALCETVGITNWATIAAPLDSVELPADSSTTLSTTPFTIVRTDLPNAEPFYGRTQEVAQLEQWCSDRTVNLILITGFMGIGKTALALNIVDRVQGQFEQVIWRSLSSTPSFLMFLNDLLNQFGQEAVSETRLAIAQLFQGLRQGRKLLVLDGIEAVLESEERDDYRHLLRSLSLASHPSQILVTSRDQPQVLTGDVQTNPSLILQGLNQQDSLLLLNALNLSINPQELSILTYRYQCNPLLLKWVAALIHQLFGGNVAAFVEQPILSPDNSIRNLFQQQLEQLSNRERDLIYWLAIWQEPIPLSRIQSHWMPTPSPTALLETIAVLDRRSLVETWIDDTTTTAATLSFTIAPIVLEWVTKELTDVIVLELQQAFASQTIKSCKILRSHLLLRPGTDEIMGDRIIKQVQTKLSEVQGISWVEDLTQMRQVLENQSPWAIGYLGANIAALLKPFTMES